MKKLLIVGDSLAGGLPHLCFTVALSKMLPEYEVISRGVGGDTLLGISRRVQRFVPLFQPDVLVMEGGANDIALPNLKQRNRKWKWLAEHIEKRGSIPTSDVVDFKDLYSRTIAEIKQQGLEIIITTLSCMGEDLKNKANKKREQFNAAIREVAEEHHIKLADVGRAFEERLRGVDIRDRYEIGRFRDPFLDTFHALTPGRADRLSKRRGLILTIDGSHLNPQGARLFAETVYNTLNGTAAHPAGSPVSHAGADKV